ncbi:MAG: hypothetical protein JNN22_06515 [Rhodospirillales bacterium]|nr:hypothetical protein [Rhodospirillales bacterium]
MTVLLVALLAFPARADDISRMAPFLDVQGIVEGDVTLAGGRISVEAEISGDMVLAGGSIGVGAATRVARNAFVFADEAALGGQYAQRVWVAANMVVFDGTTSGDASFAAARVVIGPHARIGGRLKVWSADPVEIDPRAVVAGGTEQNFGGATNAIDALLGFVGMLIRIAFDVLLVVAALALAAFAPGFLGACATNIAMRPGASLAWGAGLAVCVPLLALFAAITLVGLPFAGTLVLALALALALGYIVAAGFLGDLALKAVRRAEAPHAAWRLAAIASGLVALAILRHIPVAGTPLLLAAFTFGLGALALETRRRLR